MKWLLFAFKNVLRNRRRSLITIIITAIGSAAILIGGGFALFTYDGLKQMATLESGHLVIAHKDYFSSEEVTSTYVVLMYKSAFISGTFTSNIMFT